VRVVVGVAGAVAAALVVTGCGFRLPIPLPTTIVTNPAPSPTNSEVAVVLTLDPSGAVDVGAFEASGFASPDGSTRCAISEYGARCDLPDGFTGTSSFDQDACPDPAQKVTGVEVAEDTEWICDGDSPSSLPPGAGQAEWSKHTGFPTVKRQGSTWVTLPIGQKLIAGDFLCLSATSGITCGSVPIGAGFTITRSAVTLY
jgi:hypothetical protein